MKANNDTPAWLQEENEHDNEVSVVFRQEKVAEPVESSAPAEVPATEANSSVPRMIFLTRIINLLLSVGIIIVSFLSLLTTTSTTSGVLACYVVIFSCMLCCYETHLKQVSKIIATNFGFLYSAKSRTIFMVFIGTIMFNFSVFGQLMGLLMLGNAGFNMFVLCMYPGFEEASRTDAQSEIQDFLKSNPAYAKQALAAGMAAGSHIIAENPELAREGTKAMIQASMNNNKGYAKI